MTFPFVAKGDVNGDNAHELYKILKENSNLQEKEGTNDIPWNFTKMLIKKDGSSVAYTHPKTAPNDILDSIKEALKWDGKMEAEIYKNIFHDMTHQK